MATAKVFKHGNSQAVRLPKAFRVTEKELDISRVGNVLVLRPKKIRYEDVIAAVAGFRGTILRDQPADQERDWNPKKGRQVIWLFDTNTVIYLANRVPGHERIARRMSGRTPGEIRMSAVTLSELEWGIARGAYVDTNRASLESVLTLIVVDDYPAAAAQHFGEIKATLQKRGRMSQPYDLLIGAHARALDATLVTANTDDFKHMPGLRLVNWLKP